MVLRMQVTFDDEQHRRAKARAAAAGISLAEYIRRLVAEDLSDRPVTPGEISELFDLGDSGGSDVARHKDDYVGTAAMALRSRR